MIVFWLIVIAWLVACALAIRWTLPRLDPSDKELEHEEALEMDALVYGKTFSLPLPQVPPILNQSERWQARAREAESADDFWDAPTPPRAA